jgi:hypothetical protein
MSQPDSLWPGMFKLFPVRESWVSDIPAGDGKTDLLFYSATMQNLFTARIDWPESGIFGKLMASTYLAIGFEFFRFVVEYLKRVLNSLALTPLDHLITNALGGRGVFLFPRTLI